MEGLGARSGGTRMIALALDVRDTETLRVLALGAHCDDVEIGCGGTLGRLARRTGGLEVRYEVFSSTPQRAQEARAAATDLMPPPTKLAIWVGEYRESYFPYVGDAIKDRFEVIKAEFDPHLVLTHQRHDRHQDHRTISDLTWNTFRDHLILEYEIPKWDGDIGSPNVFVPLSDDDVANKLRVLGKHYTSQFAKPWYDDDTFRGLMRLRGMECHAPGRHAEAFYSRKAILLGGELT